MAVSVGGTMGAVISGFCYEGNKRETNLGEAQQEGALLLLQLCWKPCCRSETLLWFLLAKMTNHRVRERKKQKINKIK